MTNKESEKIIFEQPLNEHIRICLRLEHLFAQIRHHIDLSSEWDSRAVIQAILDILAVIDRPDLKNKLVQALHQYLAALMQLEQLPRIDKQKLHRTIAQLNSYIDILHSNRSKIGQELRENEFLTAIQQRTYTPAGTCSFSIPAYHSWLQQPEKSRSQILYQWVKQFDELKNAVYLLLALSRESSEPKHEIAKGGFYQTNLDPNAPYQMIRIELPINTKYYPEISVGRHRLSIHFFELNSKERAMQTKNDIPFLLTCSKIWTNNIPTE